MRRIRLWIAPPLLVLSVLVFLAALGERQLNAPGGFNDINFLEQVLASSREAGDAMLLADYFKYRTAEIMIAKKRDPDVLLLYAYAAHVLSKSDPERNIADIKYAVAVYKKKILISSRASLRFYLLFFKPFRALQKIHLGKERVSDSIQRVDSIRELQRLIQSGEDPAKLCEALLGQPEFVGMRASVILKLAYLNYETAPREAGKWLRQVKNRDFSPAFRKAAQYLRQKINKRKMKITGAPQGMSAAQISGLLEMGLFSEAKKKLEQSPDQIRSSIRIKEAASWLGLKWAEVNESIPFFSMYFQTIQQETDHPERIADQLVKMATVRDWLVYSAFLRYQAWAIAFFDAGDFGRAILFKNLLKTYDPLSLFSRLESSGGIFRFSAKALTVKEMESALRKLPQIAETQSPDLWTDFKIKKKRTSYTFVYQGEVYVVQYDAAGKAKKMLIVGANQMASDNPPPEIAQSFKKMGPVDRFFYDQISRGSIQSVNLFKKIIFDLSRNESSTWTRVYTELELKDYILTELEKGFGKIASGYEVGIDEKGFWAYTLFDLKVMKLPAEIRLKLLTEGEEGRLILNIDSVKVKQVGLPRWVLDRIQKSFELAVNSGAGESALEILSIKYLPGGALIQCRKQV